VVTSALGAVLVAVSWLGAADATTVGTQVRWTNLGVAGVVVLGAGVARWILVGRRATGRLRRAVVESPALARRLAAPAARVDRGALAVDRPVAGRHMTRYHRVDCPLVAGKPVKAAAVATHQRGGRRPCGVCQPHGAAHQGSAAGA
jgi:hypothetical protein